MKHYRLKSSKQTGMQIISEVNTTNLIVLSLFFFQSLQMHLSFPGRLFHSSESHKEPTLWEISSYNLLLVGVLDPQGPHSSSDWFSSCFPQKPHNQSYVWVETTDNLNKFREETRTHTNIHWSIWSQIKFISKAFIDMACQQLLKIGLGRRQTRFSQGFSFLWCLDRQLEMLQETCALDRHNRALTPQLKNAKPLLFSIQQVLWEEKHKSAK